MLALVLAHEDNVRPVFCDGSPVADVKSKGSDVEIQNFLFVSYVQYCV